MQTMSKYWQDNITSSARMIKGKVELYDGSTLAETFLPNTNLSSIKVERTPTKDAFFGYTISQKATITLLNKDNDIEINKGQEMRVYVGTGAELANLPHFKIYDYKKNEVKGTMDVYGYDVIHTAADHALNEINITFPAGFMDYARAIASFLGTELVEDFGTTQFHEILFTEEVPPNYEGIESLRDVLEDIAQATGSICFVDADNKIHFKLLENHPVAAINKSQYFTLEVGDPLFLSRVSVTTELGDNISNGDKSGFNQIIHNNPFFEVNVDETVTAMDVLLSNYQNSTFYSYKIKWRGNPALEIGDCVSLELKDGSTIPLIYLGETLTYNGGLTVTSEWSAADQSEIFTNPNNLGEALKQTFAKVDKVNKQIDLVVSESEASSEAVAAMQLTTNRIEATVSQMKEDTGTQINALGDEVATLTSKVSTAMTPENVQILIENELAGGMDKVTTRTGYTFDEMGLTISKTDSEMVTQITDNGMTVEKNEETVLVADNQGVKAANLHAITYLIIGNNSRFEDYTNMSGEFRTGCFWIR